MAIATVVLAGLPPPLPPPPPRAASAGETAVTAAKATAALKTAVSMIFFRM
jgi:hypothetical protein